MTISAKALKPFGLIPIADASKDREDWRAKRRPLTTATQAAVIAGGHPYSTLIDVWNDKTDPEWIEAPNRYLDERAALGNDREAAIVQWASQALGIHYMPNSALLTSDRAPGAACTPDGIAIVHRQREDDGLHILDAKTTQQNWHEPRDYINESGEQDVEPIGKPIGIPQHVTDQMLWTYKVTGAESVRLAVEQYTWAKGVATLVDSYILDVPRDPVRLAYLEAKVAEFESWKAAGIAPESDIDLRELAPTFDSTPEELADIAALTEARDAMEELGDVRARIAPDLARIEELEAIVKAAPKVYAGRRVWLIGDRFIAKLVRSNRVSLDQSKLNPADIRAARSWGEVETVKIEPNPEWTPPADTETE